MSDDRRDGKNQGEGDKESARRYNENVREFVVYGDPDRAAREARDAVDGPEGDALKAAEARGKAPAHMTRLEQLAAVARRVRHAATELVQDVAHRVQARRQARSRG